MDSAKGDAEMLFVENHWYIFKDSVRETSHPEFLNSNTLELSITFDLFEVALELKLVRAPLVQQVTEHKFDLHIELCTATVLYI